MVHILKILPEYMELYIRGLKSDELRKDDRLYSVSDELRLWEWNPHREKFTGVQHNRIVTACCRGGAIPAGYVYMCTTPANPPGFFDLLKRLLFAADAYIEEKLSRRRPRR